MDKKKDSRKWVVRAIIAFVVILGLLTFFSNTIMNMTIPKVIGAYASRGNLSYTNSATGTIDITNKTDVIGIEGREIDEVLVGDYDYVMPGDVILTLKAADETALEGLRSDLADLERQEDYANRQPSDPTDYTSYREAITMAEESLREANETLAAAQNRDATIASASQIIRDNQGQLVSLNAEVTSASDTMESINYQISVIDSQLETIEGNINILNLLGTPTPTPMQIAPVAPSEPDEDVDDPFNPDAVPTPIPNTVTMDDLCAERDRLNTERTQLESQLASAQSRLDSASARLANLNGVISEAEETIAMAENLPTVTAAQSQVNTAASQVTAARRALTNAQIQDGISYDQTQDAIEARHEQMDSLREQIAELESQVTVTEICATAEGMIYGIQGLERGDVLLKDQVLCSILPDERECYVNFTFSASVAENLWVGMSLTTDSYWVRNIVIENIKPDANNPRESRIVRCSVSADWAYPGEQITVIADRANSNYDHVISSSAINEDNNGTFVYVIQQSTGPLGDKYVVKKVSVTIEATDGSLSAISGDGLDGVQIVTRSEEPLHDGDRVRLEDYSNK